MAKIFICYRRDDSGPAAGRIYDRLERHFDRGQVFVDVDDIPLGVDYRDWLDRQIRDCDLVLVVMGREWLTAREPSGARRLDTPRDFVRTEIEIALQRKIPLIPILLEGAAVPGEDQLPAGIRALAYRQAARVHASGGEFRGQMERLIRGIEWLLTHSEQELRAQPAAAPPEMPEAAGGAPRRQPHSGPPGRMPGPSAKDGNVDGGENPRIVGG